MEQTCESEIVRTLCFYSEPSEGKPPTYLAEASGLPGKRNYEHDRVRVAIRDIRDREAEFSLRTHSFAALPGAFSSFAVDFSSDNDIVALYIPFVKALLLQTIADTTNVVVFDYTIRKASAVKTASRQVRKIHIDQSPVGALGRACRHLDEETVKLIETGEKRFLIVNVWKSLNGTVTDHPLTFADCRSLCRSDLVPVKQIYHDYIGETYAARSRDQQKFWYWSNMQEDDILLLQCFDSLERESVGQDGLPFAQCAHGSFELTEGNEEHERKSIEVRCLITY